MTGSMGFPRPSKKTDEEFFITKRTYQSTKSFAVPREEEHDGCSDSQGQKGKHMQENKQNNNEKRDWASDLINHLLTVMESAKDHLPNGYSVDGLSYQSYGKDKFSINFQFNKKA